MFKKILVGISGWVDSAVSAYLLKQAGYDVVGGFMINYLDESDPNCTTKKDLEEFKKIVDYLDIPYEIWDFRKEYEDQILNYIYQWYLSGITPNPDILCNNLIKFGLFLDEAIKLGFDMVATGHYARVGYYDKILGLDDIWWSDFALLQAEYDRFRLYRWVDYDKDQSYFLSWLTQSQLSRSIFPLWSYTKSQVREIAHQIWLPNADRKDSQWLCFVGNINMSKFLLDKIGPKPWDILDKNGNIIGQHKWAYLFTIWQRRGIWLSSQSYVIDIDVVSNTIIVWTKNDLDLFVDKVVVDHMHWIWQKPVFWLQWYNCFCKIRYRQQLQAAQVIYNESSWIYTIKFAQPQKWVPDWQVAVIYDGEHTDWVRGSGIISN